MNRIAGIWITALLTITALLLVGCTRIEPGNVGLKVDLLGESRTVSDINVVSGWVFYNPWATQIVKYPYITQRYEWWGDDALRFNSTEGVRLSVDVAISLGVDPDATPALYIKYRRTLDSMIDNEIRDRVNGCMLRAASDMRVDALIGDQRGQFINVTVDCIQERLRAEGFILNDFQLTSDFDMPTSIRTRIEEQIQAQQAAIAAQNTIAQREAEARQRIAQAEGEAQARMLQAQAEAEAINIQGQALRQNPEILQLQFIERWDGVMPQTLVGGDGSGFGGVLLNMGR
jgi:regulator of protease activity HflC (stomatin/prohibitin superfamily)